MTTTTYEPQEVIIRHGAFWYYVKEPQMVIDKDTGLTEEVETWVQRTAFQNQVVKLERQADFVRGTDLHAFWTDDELKSSREGLTVQAPVPGGFVGPGPEQLPPDDTRGDGLPDPLAQDLSDRTVPELAEWIMAVGEFDGHKKPNAVQTVQAAGDNPDLAARLKEAESQAQGDRGARSTVIAGLDDVIERNTADGEGEGGA